MTIARASKTLSLYSFPLSSVSVMDMDFADRMLKITGRVCAGWFVCYTTYGDRLNAYGLREELIAMLYDHAVEAAAMIKERLPVRPEVAVILGSGLGDLTQDVRDAQVISYADIPYFVPSTVPGHAGRLLIGILEGVPVAMMQGRFHFYEGHEPSLLTFPVRVLHLLGVRTLIVSSAAGGVHPKYRPGDFMLLRDHIFLPGMAGMNPLVGPHDERLGTRFPAVTRAYDSKLRALAHSVAAGIAQLTLHEGVYTMVSGPSYETAAELRFLRLIGTDAVGMSTVPEVVVACQMGMRVLGISLIANAATGEAAEEVRHTDVLSTAARSSVAFSALMRGIIQRLA